MITVPKFGFKNTLQWLQCPKLVSRICYNGYHVQKQVHKYAPMVTVLKIGFNSVMLSDISTNYKNETLYETRRADSKLQDVHGWQGFNPEVLEGYGAL
jgi:hypothetical protein